MRSKRRQQVEREPEDGGEEKRLPLRRILRLSLRERRRLGIGILLMLIGRAAGLAWQSGAGWMIDAVSAEDARFTLNQSLMLIAGILLVRATAGGVAGYLLTVAGESLTAFLRNDVFRNVIGQEIAFFDKRETGELTSRISSDATRVQSVVTSDIPELIGTLVTLIGAIVLLVLLSPPLTGVMLLLVPPTVIGAMVFGEADSSSLGGPIRIASCSTSRGSDMKCTSRFRPITRSKRRATRKSSSASTPTCGKTRCSFSVSGPTEKSSSFSA